jgi:hypothetical protein
MLRKDTSFPGIFYSKKETRDANNRCMVAITIRHNDKSGGRQTFLDSFTKETGIELTQAFNEPINWNKINFKISASLLFSVEFDEMEFEARLTNINVNRRYSKKDEVDVFEYNLVFEKPTSTDTFDSVFSETYLKYTELDHDDKKVIVEFPVSLNLIEKEYEDISSSEEDDIL